MSRHRISARYAVGDHVTAEDGRTGLVTLHLGFVTLEGGMVRVRFHHGPARRTQREESIYERDLRTATAEEQARAQAAGVVPEAERSYLPVGCAR
ncbi:hypothetical protein [Streptomyces xantholiticus]|uniref:hypothetical protein n=1 Tax=Streptomyces xantholiticus TaxID=68285 RepID=UPI00167815F1|nr:hypothetical protein [Streptomyces xantholiticus]GGW29413.1 hypothetical protein GCM10010381_12500 [Streptomyces xantholiticus]